MPTKRKTWSGWLPVLGLSVLFASGCGQARLTLQGAGATFPAPLYQRWFQEYNQLHPDVQINYQAIGSGAGETAIRGKEEGSFVDFGATDAAFDKDYKEIADKFHLLPLTAGSIVLAYHVPGVPDGLKLSRDVYVDVFLGEITSWDDSRIAQLNPDVKLPNKKITVVRRAESSGTTFVFTQHLSTISPEKWVAKGKGPGANKKVNWPVGIGGRNNSGVAALIKQTPGAIGYLEYQYAKASKLPTAALENKAGRYVQATPQSSAATLASVEVPENFRVWIPDPSGAECYPIVTYTWVIVHRHYKDSTTADELKKVFRYCLKEGQTIAEELGYVPLPEKVATKVLERLETINPEERNFAVRQR